MVSLEALKPFILHEDQFVGCAVAGYFHEGWILDKDIVPLLLQARQKHGWSEQCSALGYGEYQPIDEATFETVIEEIKRTPLSQDKFGLGFLIRWAPLEYVEKFMKRADISAVDFLSVMEYFEHRLEIAQWPDEKIWQALQDTCRHMDDNPDEPKREYAFLSSAVETLALRQTPENAEICCLLEDKEVEAKWLELYLIDLAGARKLSAAIPSLLKRLGADDDEMPVNCCKALVRIADPEAVRSFREIMLQKDWGYRMFGIEVLERFRHPDTERIILELLDDPRLDEETCDWLICALCMQLSPQAYERYQTQWKSVAEEVHGNLHRELLVVAAVNGMDMPHADEWRQEVLEEEKRFVSWKSPAGNKLKYDADETARDRACDDAEGEKQWEEERAAWGEDEVDGAGARGDGAYQDDETYRRPEPKVGRNDPCPCGSGKKYKKCCGKNSVW